MVRTVGLFGILVVLFAESGLFFGFFLPGDSLLFTVGILASQSLFSFPMLLILCPVAAILGDSVGYWFGKKIGPKIFARDDSLFFKKIYVERTQKYYDKHGSVTVLIARFLPIVRTFAPILAGVGEMRYRKFFIFNIVGAVLWSTAVLCLGYFLGSMIPNVDAYIMPMLAIVVILSFLPAIFGFIHNKNK